MRKGTFLAAAVIAIAGAAPATAQSSFMADMIGQAVMNSTLSRGDPPQCFDGRMQPKPAAIELGEQQVEELFQAYVASSRTRYEHTGLFVQNPKMRHLSIDGEVKDIASVWDPWAPQIARTERAGLVVSNRGTEYHASWRAYAADGRLLGTYDAYMVTWGKKAGARFFDLELSSSGAASTPRPLVPFCYKPGDIETWKAAKAEREAKKAAKRAAREAAN